MRGDIVMSAYSYIEDDGVVLLPLDQRWPLEPMLTAAQIAHMVALMLRDVVYDPVSVVLGLDGRFSTVDGHHRTEASVALGYTHIPARVIINQAGARRANEFVPLRRR